MTRHHNAIRGGVVIHQPNCADPDLKRVKLWSDPTTGELRADCSVCRGSKWVSDAKFKAAPIAPSKYRCPDHPTQPVRRTARGYAVGCPRCVRPTKSSNQQEATNDYDR